MRKDNLEASKRAADSQFAQQEMADAAAKRDRLSAAGDAILSTGLNIAATTFGGTKLGQSWFGSPGGGGGATDAVKQDALKSMGGTNDVWQLKNLDKIYDNYQLFPKKASYTGNLWG
jgi:hypothetical protein